MAKFKEGDKVRVINNGYALTHNVGKFSTVETYFDDNYLYVRFEDGARDSVLESDIELVQEVVAPVLSVKEQIVAIEAALATLKTTIGV